MKASYKILITSLIAIAIELTLFTALFVFVSFAADGVDAYSNKLYRMILFIFIGLFSIYLLFSGTHYKSVSSLILGYSLITKKHMYVKIPISNLLFYGIVIFFTWLQIEKIDNIVFQVVRILVIIELGSCFVPKIGTRFSLYLLNISYEFRKKKQLPNDGILL